LLRRKSRKGGRETLPKREGIKKSLPPLRTEGSAYLFEGAGERTEGVISEKAGGSPRPTLRGEAKTDLVSSSERGEGCPSDDYEKGKKQANTARRAGRKKKRKKKKKNNRRRGKER